MGWESSHEAAFGATGKALMAFREKVGVGWEESRLAWIPGPQPAFLARALAPFVSQGPSNSPFLLGAALARACRRIAPPPALIARRVPGRNGQRGPLLLNALCPALTGARQQAL